MILFALFQFAISFQRLGDELGRVDALEQKNSATGQLLRDLDASPSRQETARAFNRFEQRYLAVATVDEAAAANDEKAAELLELRRAGASRAQIKRLATELASAGASDARIA